MLDSAANSVRNIDKNLFHVAFPSHMVCKYWRSLISGTLYLLVLFGGSDILSRRKHRHNFVPFGFSLPYDVQILAIFYLWNTIRFESLWCFLGVLTFYVLDSAANSVGSIDIISYHLAFPSHMICKYWRSFLSETLYLLDPFGAFWWF